MSLHLLPVKTGNEQFPVWYRNIHPGGMSIVGYFTVESNKMLYIGASTYKTSGGEFLFYKLNLLTNEFTTVGRIPYTTLDSRYVGGMLVDDEYLYLSSISRAQIIIFDLDTLQYIGLYRYSSSTPQSYGKIEWVNDTTICIAYTTGFIFFDTVSRTYTEKLQSSSHNSCDMAVGKRLIIANRNASASDSVLAYRIEEGSFFKFSLNSNDVAVSCYSDGKFYIANKAYLYIYDEETEEYETIIAPWSAPRTISQTRDTVFVTCPNSYRLYIYNMTRNEFRYILLPWQIPAFHADYNIIPTAFEGYYFIEYRTLGIIDHSGNSKYNFGNKYDVITLLFNKEHQTEFQYDPRFITFKDTYMMMHKGDIRYPLQTIDETNGFKSANINKADYKSFVRATLRRTEGDENN